MYELLAAGCAEWTARAALDDLAEGVTPMGSGWVAVEITDQACLVAAIERLHELGVLIERVELR